MTLPETQRRITKIIKSKERLFGRGDTIRNVFSIVSGRIDLEDEQDNGKVIMEPFTAGDIIGIEPFYTANDNLHPYTVIAKKETIVEVTPIADFLHAVNNFSGFKNEVAAQSGEKCRRLLSQRRLDKNPETSVLNKLSFELLHLAHKFGDGSTLNGTTCSTITGFTRYDIGRIIGCSREMVGKNLKDLENNKILQAHGTKQIYIPDLEPLIKLATAGMTIERLNQEKVSRQQQYNVG